MESLVTSRRRLDGRPLNPARRATAGLGPLVGCPALRPAARARKRSRLLRQIDLGLSLGVGQRSALSHMAMLYAASSPVTR